MAKQIIVGIQLVDSLQTIEKKILKAMAEQLDQSFGKALAAIRDEVADLSRPYFEGSPEALSLIGVYSDGLDAQFGFEMGTGLDRVNAIIKVILANIQISRTRVVPRGGQLLGQINIKVLQADFDDVLSIAEAIVITEKIEILPWLQWLLLRGDDIIIDDYRISFGGYPNPPSRSGKAVMRKGGDWKVLPAQFTGTKTDNWLTRSLMNVIDSYLDMISGVIERQLERTW